MRRYKPHIRKACEDIVKKSGSDIAHILVEKNKEVDTDIMNSVNSKCEDCVNVARLLELQTRRASKKFIARGYFFNDLLESVCEKIPFYYSRGSTCAS